MADDKLKLNQRVVVEIQDGVYQGSYMCRIEDLGSDYLAISSPMDNKGYIPVHTESQLRISIIGERALFSFFSRVRGRRKDQIPIILVDRPDELVRIQRRNFVRLETNMPLEYYLLPPEDEEPEPMEIDRDQYSQGEMLDLSGGGLQLKIETWDQIKKGRQVLVRLDSFLPLTEREGEQLTEVMSFRREGEYLSLGLEFLEISDFVQDKIMGWIFEKQRELRKKGLI